jgi:hypothetical protein
VTAVTLLIAGVAYGTFLRANYWASESSIFTSILKAVDKNISN